MAVEGERDFSVGEWRVRPEQDLLVDGETQVRLEPKVMDALVYFASRPGEVVSRADLEKAVWRGGLVGYDAVTGTVIKLRKALGDSAKQPRFIATVPKRGYQLIAAVERPGDEASATGRADPAVRTGQPGGQIAGPQSGCPAPTGGVAGLDRLVAEAVPRGRIGGGQAGTAGYTFHRGATVRESEQPGRTGAFRRRDHGRHHHRPVRSVESAGDRQ